MADADHYVSDFEVVDAMPAAEPMSRASSTRAIMRFVQRRILVIAGIAVAVTALAGVYAMTAKPKYVAEAIVMLGVNHDNIAQADPTTATDAPVSPEIVRSELDVVTSRAVIDRVIAQLNLASDPEFQSKKGLFAKPGTSPDSAKLRADAVEESVLKKLKVDNDGRSFGIHIQFTSKDPKKAALIANTFAQQYLAQQLIGRSQVTGDAATWLDSRMAGLKDKVTQSEQAVADYRRANGLIGVDTAATADGQTMTNTQTVSEQQLGQLNVDLVTAKSATYAAEAKLRAARSGGAGATDVLSSPLIQSLREQEADLEKTLADLKTRFGPRYPQVVSTQQQLDQIQSKIAVESQKVVQGLAADAAAAHSNEAALQGNLNALEGRVSVESDKQVKLNELERQAQVNRTIYQEFLTRYSQVAEQQTLQIPSATIVSVAKPPLVAAFPKKKILLAAGLILGLLLGGFVAYLIEYLDPTFRSPEQVENSTKIHVAGLIPDLRTTTQMLPQNYILEKPGSQFAEALRSAWADITSQSRKDATRSITVTSTTQNEGKTTFSMALARMLAASNQRVLLVDADLRFPKIAKALNVPAKNGGLAAFLSGDKPFADVAQPDPQVKGLTIMPADRATSGAQELLSGDALAKLIRAAGEHFDVVIFDTPPAAAVSDAAIISRLTDMTIFVTRWGKVSETEVNRAIRQFKSAGGRISSMVLSQVNVGEYRKYVDGYNPDLYSDYFVN